MRILVSGSSGLVGRALCPVLEAEGHTVVRLVRNDTALSDNAVYWDPARGVLAGESLADIDGVVHLAGESIASGRWTPARKTRIRESRLQGTRLLCERLAACGPPPAFLIAASAVGYYGNRGDDVVVETARQGGGFLAELCAAWEDETRRAANAGMRVVNLRLGMVLSARGGALEKMLPPFRIGLGGPLGNGAMWMSWIHIDDVANAIRFVMHHPELAGPVNTVAPIPVTNRTFTQALGHVLKRPAFMTVPAPVLRLALGEMADELLLSSLRARPQRLEDSGFTFLYPDLDAALVSLLTP
ncbi:MAG: TIGR01777 family oxidoreductase [Candidatus Hydrogenedentes bacterium]|nr:TIGR01777 family oxidoreductase [Candidatus Hydrogenedentota bacterium]